MTSDRSYRPALGHEEAVARLRADAGSQFDPVCVRVFAALELDPTAPSDEPLISLLDVRALPEPV
jgi:HD-GYP domain-containing protein (c-di-GMP phosphodiesterase class II)